MALGIISTSSHQHIGADQSLLKPETRQRIIHQGDTNLDREPPATRAFIVVVDPSRRPAEDSQQQQQYDGRLPKKTVYVPLHLELLEIHSSSSSRSTTLESNAREAASTKEELSTRTGPPLPSETTISSIIRKNHYKDWSSFPVSPFSDDDDDDDDDDKSTTNDGLSPSSPSSSGVTFINTREEPAVQTGRPSIHAFGASRPASSTISRYARYSEPKGDTNKNQERIIYHPSKIPIASHQSRRAHTDSQREPRVVGRSLSPTKRDKRRGDDHYATFEPRRSKSERATKTLDLGVGDVSNFEHPSHPRKTFDDKLWSSHGNQEAKSSKELGRTRKSWGLPFLRSKVKGKDAESHSTEQGFLLDGAKHTTKTVGVAERIDSRQHRDDCSIDVDFGRTGKQIQFLSNVVNKFGSYGSDAHDDEEEAGDAQKLCEIIRTTERLEKKLEDVGDSTKPSMTPYQVGELISAISKMHVHAAHLGRNSRIVSGGPVEGGDVVVERHAACSNWLDTLSKAMFGHTEW